jgi:hypothetical protein
MTHQKGKLMARSKVPSDADLQVVLLKRIAEYRCKRIPVDALLLPFSKDVLGSDERQPELSLLTSGRVREHEWEQRSIDALREMYENEAWIDLEYLGDDHLGDALDIAPVVTLENQHRLAVTMTRRGQIFLEREYNPASRHARAPSTKPKKGSHIPYNGSIADLVSRKEQRSRKPEPKNETEAQERIAAAIAGRRGQHEFRQKLLRIYKNCLITGCNAEEVLEAAHIQAYSEAGTFHESNGLLLRADIHTLFDLKLITIDTSDMTVAIAEELKNTVYGEFNKRNLSFPEGTECIPDRKALHDHYQSAMRGLLTAFVL